MTQVSVSSGLGVRVWGALGVVYVVWGSTYLAIKYAIETMPPLLSAGVRFLVAGLVALAAVRLLRGRAALRASGPELVTAAVSGLLLLMGGNGLVVVGEQRVPSGLAALIIACVPLWVVVLRAALRDRPSPVTVAGVLIGLVGVAVLLLPSGGGQADVRYGAVLVGAALSWSVGSLLSTRRPVPADPLFLTAVQMLTGGTGLTLAALARGEQHRLALADVSAASWIALAYLVVFGSLVAFTAYVWVLGHAPVSVVSTYAYVNPAVAVLLGVVVAGEHLTAPEVVGGLVILLAVAVVVTEESRRKRVGTRELAAARAGGGPDGAAGRGWGGGTVGAPCEDRHP
jgi:drug/metabolite transporter (DMT)-like permease